MKKLLLAITLLATPAMADEVSQKEIDLLCERMHDTAAAVHEARYNNVPLNSLLEKAEGSETMRQIIIEAYRRPRFSTEQTATRDRREFALDWQLKCLDIDWR